MPELTDDLPLLWEPEEYPRELLDELLRVALLRETELLPRDAVLVPRDTVPVPRDAAALE